MPSSHNTMRMIAMVSSMRCLQSLAALKCNWSATALILFCLANPVAAQGTPADPTQPSEHPTLDVVEFLTGAGAAFLTHEGGHLLFDAIFDAKPFLTSVNFGPLAFFAVSHETVSPREEFVISSAGFWTQE